jgi:asparagine synthase (glutamine-hydrolysing)
LRILRGENALHQRLYVDFHFTQLPTILRNYDRISMAHGVEIRSPFMDWRLVCFLFSLPTTTKIGSGFTKRILRDALRDILPNEIRTRTQKLGFPNLVEAWTSPRAQEFIGDITSSLEFQQSTIWDGKRIVRDLASGMRYQNAELLHRAWSFVQAMCLMKLFRERRERSCC